jgi:hypothetical protein
LGAQHGRGRLIRPKRASSANMIRKRRPRLAAISGYNRPGASTNVIVHPLVPAKTVPEFIAYAKVYPSKLNMASGGIGNPEHVAGELFKMLTGVSMLHVPYRGTAPALTDLLGGQTQVYFASISAAIEHIRAGKLRARDRGHAFASAAGGADRGRVLAGLRSN